MENHNRTKGIFTVRAELLKQVADWSAQDVVRFLNQNNLEGCASEIQSKGFDGRRLLDSNEVSLSIFRRTLGISKVNTLIKLITGLKDTPEEYLSPVIQNNFESQNNMSDQWNDEQPDYMNNESTTTEPPPNVQQGSYNVSYADDDCGDDSFTDDSFDDEDDEYQNFDNGSHGLPPQENSYNQPPPANNFNAPPPANNYNSPPPVARSYASTPEEGYIHMHSVLAKQKPDILPRPDRREGKRCFAPVPLPPDFTVVGNYKKLPDPTCDDGDYLNGADLNPATSAVMPNTGRFGGRIQRPIQDPLANMSRDLGPSLPPRPSNQSNFGGGGFGDELENYEIVDGPAKNANHHHSWSQPANDGGLEDYEQPQDFQFVMQKFSNPTETSQRPPFMPSEKKFGTPTQSPKASNWSLSSQSDKAPHLCEPFLVPVPAGYFSRERVQGRRGVSANPAGMVSGCAAMRCKSAVPADSSTNLRRASSTTSRFSYQTADSHESSCCCCCYLIRVVASVFLNLLQRIGSECVDSVVAAKEQLRNMIRRILQLHASDYGGYVFEKGFSSTLKTPSSSRSASPVSQRGQRNPLPLSAQGQRPLPDVPGRNNAAPPAFGSSNSGAGCIPRSTLPTTPLKTHKRKPLSEPIRAPWFFNINREKAKELLRACAQDGSFLVRTSSQSDIPYTLSVWHEGKSYNIPIRKVGDKFALGKPKANELIFDSVEAIIELYCSEPLMLYTNGEHSGLTILTISPPPARN